MQLTYSLEPSRALHGQTTTPLALEQEWPENVCETRQCHRLQVKHGFLALLLVEGSTCSHGGPRKSSIRTFMERSANVLCRYRKNK